MATESREPITYQSTGVNYDEMDPFKVMAQRAAAQTAGNLAFYHGYREVVDSRGESAFVWDEGDRYGAQVTEGLGTKNLVADAVGEFTGRSHYDQAAKDTVAMIVNDLFVVGAKAKVITAHFSVGSSSWFNDNERNSDLLHGWAEACNEAGATWGGGETPTLKGILQDNAIELSGTASGEVYPRDRLTLGDRLEAGDAIVAIESSGIHANGLTLARGIADALPEGYRTPLSDGSTYGETLLTPTNIYGKAVHWLFASGIRPSYMANITGHGWRKVMRAQQDFTYRITDLPKPQPIFDFIQRHSGNGDEEMYGNFNMGAGFMVFVRPEDADSAVSRIQESTELKAKVVGHVSTGPKQVIIEPLDIGYGGDTLEVRS